MESYFIYIMANNWKTVFYIGITNSLDRRVIEHKFKLDKNSFTAKYNLNCLLYFEEYHDPLEAIRREKQLKNWGRVKKLSLIKRLNPTLKDLFLERNR